MIASPASLNCTCSWITACVPTTSAASPLATSASISARSFFFRLPVSQATRRPLGASSGSSQPTSLRKCCSARISVGAISAHCQPASMAMAAASAATTVLPEPTSPCSRRCIGTARARSRAISSPTRRCAAVSWNGSAASNCSCRPPRRAPRGPARAAARARACFAAATAAAPAAPRPSGAARPGGCGPPAWPAPRPARDGAGTQRFAQAPHQGPAAFR